jgi:hypothetical protein
LVNGYKNIICFSDFSDQTLLKFYTIDQVMHYKQRQYGICQDKFLMIQNKKYITSSALNLKFFFYTFCYYSQKGGFFVELPDRSSEKLNTHLYYVSYTGDDTQEKTLLTLKSKSNFFVCLSCNDTCLVARDNEDTLYVWNISKEPFVLEKKIQEQFEALEKFWLDSDSDKILTEWGIVKIQDVFEGLPRTMDHSFGSSFAKIKIGFFKGLLMRPYWFAQSKYWAVKKWVHDLLCVAFDRLRECFA